MAFALLQETHKRLEKSGFVAHETLFGVQNEWKMHVSGQSLAKVLKQI
ncbi:MAG: hypothetical protein GX443_04930 [Deltaproteobacteria bacterium]|nr:hypothetical protein [Deltaproteobacteria bacterium]